MKLNNKQPIFRILSLALLFCLLFTACTPQVSPGSSGGETPSSGVPSSTPQETSSPSGNSSSIFFGVDIQIPGILLREMEEAGDVVREFDYSGGELKVNLYVTNREVSALEMGLSIFCDGVPTEYTLLDSGKTGLYEILRVEGEETKTVQLVFTPDFDLDLGKIDFHLVPQANVKSSTGMTATIPVHAVLPEDYTAQGTHSGVIGDGQIAAMPNGIKNYRSARTQMFVMDPEIEEKYMGTGELRFEIGGKEETWICAYVPAPGKYRLVFLLDGEPIALEDGKTVLNCEFAKDDEMFSAIVPLKQMISPGEHSLLAIATRVDEQGYQSREALRFVSSFRYEIVN